MEELKSQINAAIEKDLPNQIGTVLKQKLAKAEEDAVLLENTKENLREANKSIVELTEKLNKHTSLEGKLKDIETREEALKEKERNQKVFEAELKVVEADRRAGEMLDLVQTVFRSPVYRKSVSGMENRQDNQGYTTGHPFNSVTEISEE